MAVKQRTCFEKTTSIFQIKVQTQGQQIHLFLRIKSVKLKFHVNATFQKCSVYMLYDIYRTLYVSWSISFYFPGMSVKNQIDDGKPELYFTFYRHKITRKQTMFGSHRPFCVEMLSDYHVNCNLVNLRVSFCFDGQTLGLRRIESSK